MAKQTTSSTKGKGLIGLVLAGTATVAYLVVSNRNPKPDPSTAPGNTPQVVPQTTVVPAPKTTTTSSPTIPTSVDPTANQIRYAFVKPGTTATLYKDITKGSIYDYNPSGKLTTIGQNSFVGTYTNTRFGDYIRCSIVINGQKYFYWVKAADTFFSLSSGGGKVANSNISEFLKNWIQL